MRKRPGLEANISLRVSLANWSALRYFNFYRIVISGLFAVLSTTGKMPPNLNDLDGRLLAVTALCYLVTTVLAQGLIEVKKLNYRVLVYSLSLIDIVAITLLMHAAGGVTSGVGMLLVVAVAGTCLLASGRAGIFFAALASIAFLGETVFGTLYLGYTSANYTQAGLLGASCFGTAVLASLLAERARLAEPALDLRLLSRELHRLYGTWIETGNNPESTITGQGSINALVSFTELSRSGEDQSGTLVFLEDAAQTRQRAQQLKLASLGRLTASIAHEIRNPLGAISHAGQLLSESPDLIEQDRRLIDIVLQHSGRVNTIIENILNLGRRKDAVAESFELRPWLEDFQSELRHRHDLAASELQTDWFEEPIVVRIDKTQLHQVLWNLCENALRYAKSSPRIVFEAGVNDTNGRPFLDVVDSGEGLDANIADRLFEPFATSENTGTGLGLYIARELCESNQASLHLVSHDAGCRFRLTFAHPDRQQRVGDI